MAMSRLQAFVILLVAILAEVVATSALKAASKPGRWWAWLVVASGYAASFYLLTKVLQTLPLGVAYAVWSGVGTLLVAVAGIWWYGDRIDRLGWLGIGLIIAGVILLNLARSGVREGM